MCNYAKRPSDSITGLQFMSTSVHPLCSKRKQEYLCSAIFVYTNTLKVLRHGSHSFTCKLHHTCLSFVSIQQMAPPLTEVADIHIQLTNLSTRKEQRLSWPGWLTYSGWTVTHVSGHPSATAGVQDREVCRPKTDVIPLCHTTDK